MGGGSASSLVAAGILLSRVSGLIREAVFARYFGTSLFADVFKAGLRIPNLLQNLLGEGTLSASFIPVYAELLEEGREEEAGRVAGAIFALLLAAAGGVALLGIVFAPLMTTLIAPGYTGVHRELTIRTTRILFPMAGVLVLSAWSLGILNSHRRFFIPYVAPVLWNGVMIATLFLLGGRLDEGGLVIALSWGALLGGVLQFGIQLPWVVQVSRGLRIRWNTKLAGVREAVRNAGPAFAGRGVVQISSYVDTVLVSLLATGALATLTYALTLYILPISLFGMSVAAAELPELSRRRASPVEELRVRTNAGLRRISFYVIPSFVAFLALGDVVVATLYQRGRFGPDSTLLVYVTLVGFASGLLASTHSRLFSSTFFALRDTRTPARYAVLRVVLSAVLGIALMLQFEGVNESWMRIRPGVFAGVRVGGSPIGTFGLALGAGVAAWIEWWMLKRALRTRLGTVAVGRGALTRMFAAAGAAAAAGWGVRLLLPPLHTIVTGVLVLGTFGVAYFAAAAALGLPEIRNIQGRAGSVLRRFR